MGLDLAIVIIVTLVALILFVTEALRVDVVALIVMGILMASGVITPKEGLEGFSNPATVTIAAMFVLSQALRKTGAVNNIGDALVRLFREFEFWIALASMCVVVGFLSACINNTAVVAIFLPLMIDASRSADISPTRVLMPLSFAAMFGGLCTLVGTSTNILVSSIIEDGGMKPIGMFEMAPMGLFLFSIGIAYLLTAGLWFLPERGEKNELTESFKMGAFLTEIELKPKSHSAGQLLKNALVNQQDDIEVLDVIREGELLGHPEPSFELKPHDILRISGSAEAIGRLKRQRGIVFRPGTRLGDEQLQTEKTELFEAVVAPNSALDGESLNSVDFHDKYNAGLLAVRRKRELIHRNLRDLELEGGDVLLLQTPKQQVTSLQTNDAFVVVSEVGLPEFREDKMPLAVAIIIGVVGLAAIDIVPIVVSSVCGAVLCVLFRIIKMQEFYDAIDWQVIFLLGGIIPLGSALEKSGGIEVIAGYTLELIGGMGPHVVIGTFYMLTVLLTSIISNQATAILITPLAIQAAESLGYDPRTFIFAVAFGASTSFITPVGYQTNTLVYSAGEYQFADFFRVGTPLSILFCVATAVLLPWFWPLTG